MRSGYSLSGTRLERLHFPLFYRGHCSWSLTEGYNTRVYAHFSLHPRYRFCPRLPCLLSLPSRVGPGSFLPSRHPRLLLPGPHFLFGCRDIRLSSGERRVGVADYSRRHETLSCPWCRRRPRPLPSTERTKPGRIIGGLTQESGWSFLKRVRHQSFGPT